MLAFISGILIGAFVSITAMCILFVSKDKESGKK